MTKETQADFGLGVCGPTGEPCSSGAFCNFLGCRAVRATVAREPIRPVYKPLADAGPLETAEGDAEPWVERNPEGRGIVVSAPAGAVTTIPLPKAPATSLPTDAKARKAVPIYSGVLAYFPDAIIEVAKCSYVGNEQHHPGTPLHWDRAKSTDHADCLLRHLMDDLTGVPNDVTELADGRRFETPHLAKVIWRAMALLQTRIDAERAAA